MNLIHCATDEHRDVHTAPSECLCYSVVYGSVSVQFQLVHGRVNNSAARFSTSINSSRSYKTLKGHYTTHLKLVELEVGILSRRHTVARAGRGRRWSGRW